MSVLRLAVATVVILAAGAVEPPSPSPADEAPAPAGAQARAAIRRQDFPWYDASRDDVKSLLPERSSLSRRLQWWLDSIADWLQRRFGGPGDSSSSRRPGSLLPTLLFVLAGLTLLALCWRLWTLRGRVSDRGKKAATIGEAARIAGLAPGAGIEGLDPWSEADRLRLAGDRRGAVVWLFLAQVLALEHARMIRIAPGKTGRQYAAMLEDRGLRDDLRATLAVFELVYYGQQEPQSYVVEGLWTRAEAFRRRLAELEGGRTP